MNIDFKSLNEFLKPRVMEILTELLPGGRLNGREYQCGNSAGGPGDSLRYNIDKLTGSDFAAGENFGDIIDLYGKIHGVSVGDAAKQLAEKYGFSAPSEIARPGATSSENFRHYKYGAPSAVWRYNDTFHMARYDPPTGKQFAPWTLVDGAWRMKAPPKPRPLYNLAEINADRNKPVLIVEGEKAAESAKLISGPDYVVTTWPNGAAAVHAADWDVLNGRRVTIWPDADGPGRTAAKQIADKLSPLCPEIKIIKVDDHDNGWDAADANFEWEDFNAWVTQRAYVYQALAAAVTPQAVALAAVQVNIESGPDEPVVTGSLRAVWENLGVALTDAGKPIANLSNVVRILEGEPMFHKNIWFDEFYLLARAYSHGKIIDLDENYLLNLRLNIQRNYGITRITAADVRDAVALTAKRVIKNEPKDWMESLVWDDTPRIETFFIDCAGAPDSVYIRAASKNFWISMAARVYDPGCLMRTMVVLKGKQWTGKSTIFATIGGKWYAEVLENIHGNNFLQSLNGHIIMEFSDLSGFVRADINRIKQIVSCRKDTYRAPYDRVPATHPRQCVFTATTNDEEFLRDDTGNTRFWPIETGEISIPKITETRDQLFAEAVNLYKSGADWYKMPEETEIHQEKYRSADEWEEIIADYMVGKQQITGREIAVNCLRIEVGKLDKSIQIRIGRIMGVLGFRRKVVRDGNSIVRVWEPNNPKVENTNVTTCYHSENDKKNEW